MQPVWILAKGEGLFSLGYYKSNEYREPKTCLHFTVQIGVFFSVSNFEQQIIVYLFRATHKFLDFLSRSVLLI